MLGEKIAQFADLSQGRQVGVKTPLNDKIVGLVNAPGVGLLKPDPKDLDPLRAIVPH